MDEKQQHLNFMEAQALALELDKLVRGGHSVDVICVAYALSIGSFASLVEGATPAQVINNIALRAVSHAYSFSDNPPPTVQ